jgi:hypothetical protein
VINRIVQYLRRHSVASLALVCSILALASSSYAAVTISGSQIKDRSIAPVKFDPHFIRGSVRAWAIVGPGGHVITSGGKPRVTLPASDPGGYGIRWGVKVGRCDTVATVDLRSSPPTERVPVPGNPSAPFTAGYAVASTTAAPGGSFVQTYNQQGQPTPLGFDVTVIC